jgi:arabinofuranosyltransferase
MKPRFRSILSLRASSLLQASQCVLHRLVCSSRKLVVDLYISHSLVSDNEMTTADPDVSHTSLPALEKKPRFSSNEKGVIALALTFFLFVVVKSAWICDDAYTTFRVVDNFIHGYGLTWNTDERVQAYTHPLWMFVLSAVYFCTRHVYFPFLFLSVALSFATVLLLALYGARSPWIAVLSIMTLAASKSFIDYSTSGLENPLTHLLIVAFMLVFYKGSRQKYYCFTLVLIAALAALNRQDTVLLFLPALILVLWKSPRMQALKSLMAGCLPFLCWEIFSLWYYGFLVPNTAYAKLDTGIPAGALLEQGIGYFISSFRFDPLLFIVIVACLILVCLSKDWKSVPFALGILFYLCYTAKIGGDFMAGRFLTAPFLMAVIVLACTSFPQPLPRSSCFLAFAIIAFIGLLVPNSRWDVFYLINAAPTPNGGQPIIDQRGVADERAFYLNATGILYVQRGISWPNSSWTQEGLQVKASGQHVVVRTNIGFFGFAAGPHVHVVDEYGLSDPLLARLPSQPQWRIGHFKRTIPDGYLETLAQGKNHIRSKNLALYYSKLQIITRGPLFRWQRLIEIWKFNTGAYNYLLTSGDDSP